MRHDHRFSFPRPRHYLPFCLVASPLPIGLGAITRAVAFNTGLSIDDILSHSREARLARARAAVYWLARHLTAQSISQIGRFFGRDHSTILTALGRAEGFRDEDPAFRLLTDRLLAAFIELKEERHGR